VLSTGEVALWFIAKSRLGGNWKKKIEKKRQVRAESDYDHDHFLEGLLTKLDGAEVGQLSATVRPERDTQKKGEWSHKRRRPRL
jgi:hypothetical protein